MKYTSNPSEGDIGKLKGIWLESFPTDADGYCEMFFEEHFDPRLCIAVYNGDEPEEALHFFEAYYFDRNGEKRKAYYVYAVSVLKKYRGQGDMRLLLKAAEEQAKRENISALTLYSVPHLFDSYEKHGFKRFGYAYSYGYKQGSDRALGALWRGCGYERFKLLRNAYLERLGKAFYWQDRSLKFMYKDANYDGEIIACKYDGAEYYAVCTSDGQGSVCIKETNCPRERLGGLCEDMCTHFNCCSASLISPVAVHGFKECERVYHGHFMVTDGGNFAGEISDYFINLLAY